MFRHIVILAFISVPQVFAQFTQVRCQGSNFTVAEGINNNGTIVGYYYGSSGGAQGFTATTSLPTTCNNITIAGASNTFPQAINDAGVISGFYIDTSSQYHGFILNGSALTTVDYPNTSSNTLVFDINSLGTTILSSNSGFAIRNSAGSVTPFTFSHPVFVSKLGINDSLNTIVGTVGTAQNPGCFIDQYPTGTSTSFAVPGATNTYCFDVNNASAIAGTYFAGQSQYAFVRTNPTTLITLPALTAASA